MPSIAPSHHDRIVLLFDLDCFYAQCERVRLGLDVDVSLALLQWNSVLAVTYPARAFGIKRGDSWDAVDSKSNGECWGIHLKLLDLKKQQEQQQEDATCEDAENDVAKDAVVDDIESAYNALYKLTPEQQMECRKERGIRRFNHQGKACLERYRIASMRIFNVVLESLTERLGRDQFVLERASIDEFYLDVTNYCYRQQQTTASSANKTDKELGDHKTVVVGNAESNLVNDEIQQALDKACQVSHWIRTDVWNTLGFTMSAGISTNKMMAKLAASYGKPNGQAVLHPHFFEKIMKDTKIKKVRNFGGKLGKTVLKLLSNDKDGDACMGDLCHLSLPFLQQQMSKETAQFVFDACRGLDQEAVKETTGALVKSITAFKSFPATHSTQQIQNWLELLAKEVVTRVQNDAARNGRYPKTCTLNYSYYHTTTSGKRPAGARSVRNLFKSKSLRLAFPHDKHPRRADDLVHQAMERLDSILKQHALRGVGLSAGNFDSRAGAAAINTFFKAAKTGNGDDDGGDKKQTAPSFPTSSTSTTKISRKRKAPGGLGNFFTPAEEQPQTKNDDVGSQTCSIEEDKNQETGLLSKPHYSASCSSQEENQDPSCASNATMPQSATTSSPPPPCTHNDLEMAKRLQALETTSQIVATTTTTTTTKPVGVDRDMELAKRLQASFDRENYVLSKAAAFHLKSSKKKVRRIDTFFAKR